MKMNFKNALKVEGSVCDLLSHIEREKLMKNIEDVFDGKLNILVRLIIFAILK